jgi:hypothetical protein
MIRKLLKAFGLGSALLIVGGLVLGASLRSARAFGGNEVQSGQDGVYPPLPTVVDNVFQVEVLVDGRPAPEYDSRGRRYIEAFEGAEYTLRIHNPLSTRVAVALSVDGLNTIDARHTSAWDAHKWVIEPYGTIEVGGWQMSSNRARRFYFTTERDSYAVKLGQAANLGVISAVFFRERTPVVVPVTPGPRPISRDQDRLRIPEAGSAGQAPMESEDRRAAPNGTVNGAAKSMPRRTDASPPPDDESAATGIGRSVRNDVQWIKMDLDTRPANETTIRYEYRAGLVKLGIVPRDYPRPEVLDRRERARGFDPNYCPDPK